MGHIQHRRSQRSMHLLQLDLHVFAKFGIQRPERFIEEQYVTALDITAANAAGDYPRVLDLFGLSRSNERRAREALSAEYLQIAGPLFGPG